MATGGWDDKPYNEERPYGRKGTVIGGDNIEFSKMRREAIIAVKQGKATPEQIALVHETDRVIAEAIQGMEE